MKGSFVSKKSSTKESGISVIPIFQGLIPKFLPIKEGLQMKALHTQLFWNSSTKGNWKINVEQKGPTMDYSGKKLNLWDISHC